MSVVLSPSEALVESRKTPFVRLVKVEIRKLVNTRAGFWLLASIVLLTVAVMVIGAIAFEPEDRTFSNFFSLAGSPQGVLLPVLGILTVTSEWSQRTGLVTFTLEPRRMRVLLAKVAAGVIIATAVYVLVVVFAVALHYVSGSHGETPSGVFYGQAYVGQLFGILQGLGFGMLLLNTPLAIVTYFFLPTAWSIALSISDRTETLQRWLDPGSAMAPMWMTDAMSGVEWARAGTVIAIWVLVPLVVGAWRVMRTEVKSA